MPARPAPAQERWLISAEAPAALALTDPQRHWFSAGSLPGAALYRSLGPRVLLGARLRAGLLGAGESADPTLMDKGTGGLASLTAAVRLRPLPGSPGRHAGGPWLELAAGGALTGLDLRPAAEIGAGWSFAIGRVAVGPSVRYLHLVQPDDRLSPADAGLALLGVELTFLGGERRSPLPPSMPEPLPSTAPAPAPVAAVAPAPVALPVDGDGDRILDVDDACLAEAEVANGVDDDDGCPDLGLFEVVEDRIALEERVLFDTRRARVKRQGRKVLAAIAAYLDAHPEFERVEIEGHADARGPEDYNLELSRLRAERVGNVLGDLGVAAAIAVTGRGEAEPRTNGRSERAWQANRRVELTLVRRRPALPGESVEVSP